MSAGRTVWAVMPASVRVSAADARQVVTTTVADCPGDTGRHTSDSPSPPSPPSGRTGGTVRPSARRWAEIRAPRASSIRPASWRAGSPAGPAGSLDTATTPSGRPCSRTRTRPGRSSVSTGMGPDSSTSCRAAGPSANGDQLRSRRATGGLARCPDHSGDRWLGRSGPAPAPARSVPMSARSVATRRVTADLLRPGPPRAPAAAAAIAAPGHESGELIARPGCAAVPHPARADRPRPTSCVAGRQRCSPRR